MLPFRAQPPEFRPCQCHLLRGAFQWGAGRRQQRGHSSGCLCLVVCLVLPSCHGMLSLKCISDTLWLAGPRGPALHLEAEWVAVCTALDALCGLGMQASPAGIIVTGLASCSQGYFSSVPQPPGTAPLFVPLPSLPVPSLCPSR